MPTPAPTANAILSLLLLLLCEGIVVETGFAVPADVALDEDGAVVDVCIPFGVTAVVGTDVELLVLLELDTERSEMLK
jgi:hypothetical protein